MFQDDESDEMYRHISYYYYVCVGHVMIEAINCIEDRMMFYLGMICVYVQSAEAAARSACPRPTGGSISRLWTVQQYHCDSL